MTKLAEVHTLYTRNGRDIPGRLREAAFMLVTALARMVVPQEVDDD